MTTQIGDTESLALQHRARQYYIQCAKHVIDIAPLPEFKDAIALLEVYDDEPNDENREDLMRVYSNLADEKPRREYGYTAVGQFFIGLKNIIFRALFSTDSVLSSDTQYFTEAVWCAAKALHCSTAFNDIAERAQHKEYEWQNTKWKEIFDAE